VSDHPLLGAERALRRRTDCSIAEVVELEEGSRRSVGGVITGLQKKWTKRGDLMAVFTLEDLQGSIEVMVFPKTMASIGHLLADDAVVVLTSRLDARDDTPKLVATDVELFEPMADGAPPLRLQVSPARLTDGVIEQLKALLAEHPGDSEVFVHLGRRQVLRLSDDYFVSLGGGLVAELRVLLGMDSVIL
jgi:DNA polymerase-3 subunit alpha